MLAVHRALEDSGIEITPALAPRVGVTFSSAVGGLDAVLQADRRMIAQGNRYCLHLSELFKTDRVVPVVIFIRPGSHPASLTLNGDWNTYMFFRFITCDLGLIPAEKHMTSTNIVARLNLPNMAYPDERRLDVYAEAREGLVELEPNPRMRDVSAGRIRPPQWIKPIMK